jgi:uncharacterized protein (DUF1684 family)
MPHTRRRGSPRASVGFLLTILGVTLAGCGAPSRTDNSASYVQQLAAARAEKDEAFKGRGSPVPADRQQQFLPLSYFAVDPDYSVAASLTLAPSRTPVEMPTSTGVMRKMELVGTLQFTLKGQPLTLGAFVEAGQPPDRLFVPFADPTNGTETYQAGRYLDLDRTPTGIYMIDFNRAYNPYCYYNATYECPYPPPSNRLKVPILAGEKMRR